MDQTTCITLCVKNKVNCADAFRMLTLAYKENTLDQSNGYWRHKMFSEGRENVNDEERAGRPKPSATDKKFNKVDGMVSASRWLNVWKVAEGLNISMYPCHLIFINDLGMKQVVTKFVHKLLNCKQKQHRMKIASEMLDSVHDNPNSLHTVITGYQSWDYGYDMDTKA